MRGRVCGALTTSWLWNRRFSVKSPQTPHFPTRFGVDSCMLLSDDVLTLYGVLTLEISASTIGREGSLAPFLPLRSGSPSRLEALPSSLLYFDPVSGTSDDPGTFCENEEARIILRLPGNQRSEFVCRRRARLQPPMKLRHPTSDQDRTRVPGVLVRSAPIPGRPLLLKFLNLHAGKCSTVLP